MYPDKKLPNNSGMQKHSSAKRKVKKSPRNIKAAIFSNPFIYIFLPILIIVIIIAVILIFRVIGSDKTDVPASVQNSEDYVYVLPITQRPADASKTPEKDPFANGFSAVKLTGIMYDPKGNSLIILSTETSSYVVSVGEKVGESSWTVKTVNPNSVVIENGTKQEVLVLEETSSGDNILSPNGAASSDAKPSDTDTSEGDNKPSDDKINKKEAE